MRNLPRIMEKVLKQPWAVSDSMFETILQTLGARMAGKSSGDEIITLGENDEDIPEPFQQGETMIIPVHGIIGKHLSSFEMMCGGCDLDQVNEAIDVAMGDSIANVVMDFRTPGGTITGVPETAERIADLASIKQVVAYTDSEMCSAGYWMGAQCSVLLASRTSRVGSIGVRLAFLDKSRYMAMMGLEVHSFQGGELKTMGAFWRPPTEKEKAMFQAGVDKLYGQFKDAVREKRECSDESMQGQCMDGDEALEAGLIDGIASDIDEAIEIARA